MPNTKSAWRRMRQNEERRQRNRPHRSNLRKVIKSFRNLEEADAAREQFPGVVSIVDMAAKKGIIHSRKAARIKSRLARKLSGS